MIKRFKITKLFGFRTINIPFEKDVKILVGENGLGKTTVLNSLYYVLNEKYHKLYQIDFEKIELTFSAKEKISFTKKELESYLRFQDRGTRRNISSHLMDFINLDELYQFISDNPSKEGQSINSILELYLKKTNVPRIAPTRILVQELLGILKEPISKKFNEFKEVLKKQNFSILYFPTYRRVEEDLKNLGKFRKRFKTPYEEEEFIEEIEEEIEISDDTLIHFGMEDVEERLKKVESQINKSTMAGFSKVTGEMLSQLLQGFPNIEDQEIDQLDAENAKIVLHRVGDSLSSFDRKQILNLLERKEELKQKKELVYFLFKLIDIYNQHRHIDDAIKKFRDICNKYLEDKNFVCNESSVNIKVYRKGTKEEVQLNKLSSGEKQIVSLFSKLYLESKDNLFVLFDEPELSLSLEWQKQLLPDIVNSDKCKFLLSVTHSPFIFKNELDSYAVGMSTYVK